MSQAPWKCSGHSDCHRYNSSNTLRAISRPKLVADNRTVETQAQGLAVVRAATDLTLGNRSR